MYLWPLGFVLPNYTVNKFKTYNVKLYVTVKKQAVLTSSFPVPNFENIELLCQSLVFIRGCFSRDVEPCYSDFQIVKLCRVVY